MIPEPLFECTDFMLKYNAWYGKINNDKLELISDADMYFFFEKIMRDRVSYISRAYSKASNKYLKSYGPKQESKHIIFFEANNLYGYAIYKVLPTSGFKWIDPKDVNSNKYSSHSSTG